MKLCLALTLLASASAFTPVAHQKAFVSTTARFGYLDNLTKELYGPDANPDPEKESREATKLDKDKVDRMGPGDWSDYVDFEEFDGGDGQMGVAGDGKAGLDKEWKGQARMAKSKMMSAKNAWGSTTGYADKLIDEGVEAQRAQQLENWHNQQAVLRQRKDARYMTDEFDQVEAAGEADWRTLSNFGVERNQDFDMDEVFGPVKADPDNFEGTVEIASRLNTIRIHEFKLKNSFMGFSDFRAAFTPETSGDWAITPPEGSLSGKEATDFVLKFKPSNPGTQEGFLVIDTEDTKWTWKLIGSTSG